MIFNLILLFCFYFLITFSVIGYGSFFYRLVSKDKLINIGLKGLFGFYILIIYSYISHFFISHNLLHNTLILLLGILLFIFSQKKELNKKLFLILLINFSIIFIGLLIFKTHDDFPYYHFAYSIYITQEPMIIGIGQFNHGFRTHSSIFYLNSLFYLPFIKYYSFYIPTLLILGFSNLIFLSNINHHLKKKNINYIFYLSILFFVFFNIFFYRIQEHGTDRSAQILISILLIQFFYLISFYKDSKFQINFILIILGLIISLKAFYVLYLIFFFPFIWILLKEKKLDLLRYILKSPFFYIFLLLFFLIISVYFFNTGCLVYPVSFTCFNNFEWSIGIDETVKMNNHYQLWSKAGKTPNFLIDDPEIYLKNFNWVSNWIDLYFFNKVSDFLFGLLILCFFIFIIFRNKNINKKKKSIKLSYIYLTYVFIFILLFEWFLNHPALRYGGYILIASIIFIPFSIILEKQQILFSKIKPKLKFIILLTIVIFVTRNSLRIHDEMDKYNYKPLTETFYYVDQKHFRISNLFKDLIENFDNCKNEVNICDDKLSKKVKEFYPNRYIFIND